MRTLLVSLVNEGAAIPRTGSNGAFSTIPWAGYPWPRRYVTPQHPGQFSSLRGWIAESRPGRLPDRKRRTVGGHLYRTRFAGKGGPLGPNGLELPVDQFMTPIRNGWPRKRFWPESCR